MQKQSLRIEYKNKLKSLSESQKQTQSELLVQKISGFLKNKSGSWTLFAPLKDEPQLLPLLKQCDHIDWLFPKVETPTEMSFRRVSSLSQLVKNSWGLEEPSSKEIQVDVAHITGALVPGLAFDSQGCRLGRGAGYYDRFLKYFKGLKLGVTFNEGIVNGLLPREVHDQVMNVVISPLQWIEVNCEVRNGI